MARADGFFYVKKFFSLLSKGGWPVLSLGMVGSDR